MRRLSLCIVLTCVFGVSAGTSSQAAMLGYAAAKHSRSVHKAAGVAHGMRSPSLLEPSNGAHVQQIPALTWSAVAGASEYEYQFAADPHFGSILVHSARGRGGANTHNLAASLEK